MIFLKEGKRRVIASISDVIKLLVEISLWGFEKEKKYIKVGRWENIERDMAQMEYLAYKENE